MSSTAAANKMKLPEESLLPAALMEASLPDVAGRKADGSGGATASVPLTPVRCNGTGRLAKRSLNVHFV
jgi:hypothetical protein